MEQSRRGRVNMNIMQVNPPPVFSLGSVSAPVIVSVIWSFVSLCFFSFNLTRFIVYCSVQIDVVILTSCSLHLTVPPAVDERLRRRWTPPEDQTQQTAVMCSVLSVQADLWLRFYFVCVGTSTCFWCERLSVLLTRGDQVLHSADFLDKTLFYFIFSLTEMEINIENKTSGSDVGKWLTGFSD